MIELILVVCIFALGYVAGQMVFAWKIRDIIYKEATAAGIDVQSRLSGVQQIEVEKLIIEESNNMLYLYEYDTDNFVCQAKTIDELATLANRYKNIKYAAVAQGETMHMFVEGKVKKAMNES